MRKLTIWRVNLVWYLVALGLPFLIPFIASAPGKFFNAEASFELAPLTPLGIVVFVFVVGEELGWRGFAQPELEKHYSPIIAAAILGMLWVSGIYTISLSPACLITRSLCQHF